MTDLEQRQREAMDRLESIAQATDLPTFDPGTTRTGPPGLAAAAAVLIIVVAVAGVAVLARPRGDAPTEITAGSEGPTATAPPATGPTVTTTVQPQQLDDVLAEIGEINGPPLVVPKSLPPGWTLDSGGTTGSPASTLVLNFLGPDAARPTPSATICTRAAVAEGGCGAPEPSQVVLDVKVDGAAAQVYISRAAADDWGDLEWTTSPAEVNW